MMSSEPQPRRTAEKRRFSTTAVQAIHQRRRWAVARVGAMARRGAARCGDPAPARASLCSHLRADLGVSARPYPAGAANPGRCRSARSFSPPPQRGRQVRAARKPQPCLGPGPPSPPLAHPPARSSGRSRPGQAGRLLSRLTRRETEAQKHEMTNACSWTWN